MSNILWGFADLPQELNTSKHRVETPMRILLETGRHQCKAFHISHLQNPNPLPEVKDAINDAEIIILERLLLKELWPCIDAWHKAGKKVVSTFDDAYHLMPKSGGIAEQTWRGGKRAIVGKNADGSDKTGSILNEFRQTLRLVDTALVPSRVLLEDYKPYCPTIQYVPNVPYLPLWKDLKKRPIDNNFVIGWGGSTAHDKSWLESGLPQALGLICKKYARVHVHLQTKDPKILIALDKANARYDSHFWTTFETWPSVVARFDLGVAPLAGEYDRRRSAIKHWESGLAHIPFIGTDLEPYQDGGGGSILVENRSSEWANAISSVIDDRGLYDHLAEEGYKWAISLYENAPRMYEEALGIEGYA